MQAMCTVILVLCLSGMAAGSREARAEVTPVQKVLQLMEGMLAKGEKDMHEEQTQYAAYSKFCSETSAFKGAFIKKATRSIRTLSADIVKYTANIEDLTQAIADNDLSINTAKRDISVATKTRDLSRADYVKLHDDYSESIDALERAISVLKKHARDKAQKVSLLHVKTLKNLDLIPEKAKKAIDLFFMQGMDAADQLGGPLADAYEFQSGGIVHMLEELHDEFYEKRTELEKEELKAKLTYDQLKSDLDMQIQNAEVGGAKASSNKAENQAAKAAASAELKETKDLKASDEKYKSDLDATCAQKATDFQTRQNLRQEELEVIHRVLDIIKSSAVAGSAAKHLPSLAQKGRALAHLRSVSVVEESKVKVAQFLSQRADQLGSRMLATIAARVSKDPFEKVKKMIKDMVVKLMEEANLEASQKAWCDTELATNAKTRNAKTEAIEKLNAEIDILAASSAELSAEVAELSEAVAQVDVAIKEATSLREAEKEENAETVKDSTEAQTVLEQALQVLKKFYAKAATATALVQKQKPPPIFEGAYKGMTGEGGGVIQMLEVLQSDFARLETDTRVNEAASQKEYDEFVTDSQADKKAKSVDLEDRQTKKQRVDSALVSAKTDIEQEQDALDAAMTYYDKLKPSCVNEDVSYAERVAHREDEIKSLQEALKILDGKGLA